MLEEEDKEREEAKCQGGRHISRASFFLASVFSSEVDYYRRTRRYTSLRQNNPHDAKQKKH